MADDDISLFRSQLEHRRFTPESLRILESVLVTKDVPSLAKIRSALQLLLRFVVMSVLTDIADKATLHKLHTVDFFVKAFALIGDVESCLALKYEAFILRESKYCNNHGLRVSYEEWLIFAKDSFDNGFYTIAVKGFENALLCVQSNNNVDPDLEHAEEHVINNIKRLKEMAVAFVASHSVQTESANHLKRKAICSKEKSISCSSNKEQVASSTFRRGINKRNTRKLSQSQNLFRDPVVHKPIPLQGCADKL